MAPIGEAYLELLAAEGYRPERQGDEHGGDIVFKSEGALFRLGVDEVDREFFALSLCYGLEDEGVAMERLLHAANGANEYWKVVKVTVHPAGEAVRFQFEAFGQLTPALLQRAIQILRLTCDRFFEEIRESAPAKATA
jgi:hypothetical protein